jgi:hypothetical protein
LGLNTDIPIELECWMLKWGIMPKEHLPSKPDIVWPEKKEVYQAWKPSYDGEEPPH